MEYCFKRKHCDRYIGNIFIPPSPANEKEMVLQMLIDTRFLFHEIITVFVNYRGSPKLRLKHVAD